MPEVVKEIGLKREPGYLYFIDKQGDVSRVPMKRGNSKDYEKPAPEKVALAGIEREQGYLYYVDKQGNISRFHKDDARKKRVKS